MKKILYKSSILFMLVLSMAIITSCEDEGEGGGPDAAAKLIGTWTMTDSDITIKVGGVDILTVLMTVYQMPESEAKAMVDLITQQMEDGFNGTITFKDDKTYSLVLPDEGEAGTWRVSEDGNTLYTTPTGMEEDDMTIHTLTESMLVVKWSEQETEEFEGIEVEMDMEITLTLTK